MVSFRNLGSSALEMSGRVWMRNALVTVGAAVLVPLVLPVITRGMRPLAKGVIRGGLMLTDKAKEVIAEAGEQWSDLVAEVRADIKSKEAESAQMMDQVEGQEA